MSSKKEQTKKYFEKMAEERDRWRKKNSYYHNDIKNFLRYLIPPQVSILEIGSATGDITKFLSKQNPEITGIDFSPEMVNQAQAKYPDLQFSVQDIENTSLSQKYDYIIMSDTLGFLDDIQSSLAKVRQASHPQSRLIITSYNHLWQLLFRIAEKIKLKMPQPIDNWLSPADIEQLLYLADFEIVKQGQRILFPKYLPFISSFLNRFVAKMPIIKHLCLVNYFVARPKPVTETVKDHPSISVIIAARNEEGNIENAIKRIPAMGSHTEIIFVEGGSTDNTWAEIKRVQAKYSNLDIKAMQQDGKGKGDAVRKGFAQAQGDILSILDADLTMPPEELPKFYQAIVRGDGDFINGSRLVYRLEDDSMQFLNILGNKFFGVMFSWLLEQRIKDTLCGTKVIWRHDYKRLQAGRKFFGDFDPFGDFDLLFGAAKLNLKIIDLPIHYQARTYGETNISRFSHGWLLIRMFFFAINKIKFI